MRLAFWKKKDTATKKKKSVLREWVDAAVFAIVAATIIRTFFIEAYTIPTPSMEGSLLVNDFLFVSKLSYGPRVPMTPLSFPLVHNTMPLIGGKSYSEAVQWKYRRWPGFGDVKRYDVVVFNFPNNDTVVAEMPDRDYYEICRQEGGRDVVHAKYTIITRPVDKKENYIKRCVGIPGDKIQIIDGILHVNDKPSQNFPHVKMNYFVRSSSNLATDALLDDLADNDVEFVEQVAGNIYIMNVPNDKIEFVKHLPGVDTMGVFVQFPKGTTPDMAFPQDPTNFNWNRDNFGPFIIPKKGTTVTLTLQNIALYRRIIFNYEQNQFEETGGRFFINGKETNAYTFKMDYYWMMGDNRHNSADSRYFGFVPEDHIVGKASFVWFSYKEKLYNLRWSRIFRGVKALED
jgi:signal peptidase I